ncbi:unnamed protein product, partial [marine sediment metagenome]
ICDIQEKIKSGSIIGRDPFGFNALKKPFGIGWDIGQYGSDGKQVNETFSSPSRSGFILE